MTQRIMNIDLRIISRCLLVFSVWVATHSLVAQTPFKRPSPEEMKKLTEAMRPGPEHELLRSFSGQWTVEIKAGRNAVSTGNANSYMLVDGRFLWIGYGARGESGAFRGSFIIGFDRRNERYDLIGMDTTGTYFITSHGKPEKDSKRVKLLGKDDDPYMKSLGYEKEFAHVIDLSDPDRLVIEVLFIDTRTEERKEQKAMELVFTRKSDAEDGQEKE